MAKCEALMVLAVKELKLMSLSLMPALTTHNIAVFYSRVDYLARTRPDVSSM